jgi:hypothetical protein
MSRVALAAPLVGLLLVAGCSDDSPDPRIAPTPSDTTSAASTSSPDPDPTPTGPVEPTLPPEAEGTDAAAAEAFVKFYWEMSEYAQATGDVSGLNELASASCENCRSGSKYLKTVYADGGSIRGGAIDIVVVRSTPYKVGPVRGYEVEARVTNTRQVVDWPADREDEVFPAGEILTRFLVEIEGDRLAIGFWESV